MALPVMEEVIMLQPETRAEKLSWTDWYAHDLQFARQQAVGKFTDRL